MNTHIEIGVDLGSLRSVIGVVKKGGIEILMNEGSYRQTPNLVAFTNKERNIGDPAQIKFKTNFRNTISFFTRFLNLNINSEDFKKENQHIYCRTVGDEQGKVQFVVNNKGEDIKLYPEQVLACMFTKYHQILEFNNIDNKNMVVSVPNYLTIFERQRIIDAAQSANIKLTNIINESSAVVLNYGFYRRTSFKDDKPSVIAFLDFGHSKFSGYVAKFYSNRAEIISEVSERHLGARDLDLVILNRMIEEFNKSTGIDISRNVKAKLRLLEVINKQRGILSANPEANITVECLAEDEDFHYNLTREDFNNMSIHFFEKIGTLINKLIIDSKVDVKDFSAIEILGGASRTPFFQQIVSENFKDHPINKTLDATDTIAKGAALKAAIESPLVSVKDYKVENICLTHYMMSFGTEEKSLFKDHSKVPKELKFFNSASKDSSIDILINDNYLNGYSEKLITNFTFNKKSSNDEKAKINVYVKLNDNGFLSLNKLELEETVQKEVEPSKKEDENKMKVEGEEEEVKKEMKTVINKKDITSKAKITCNYFQKVEKLQEFSALENKFVQDDNLILNLYKAKNDLESFVYDIRSRLEADLKGLYLPNELQGFYDSLTEAENYIYNNSEATDKNIFITKKQNLEKIFNNVITRFSKLKDMSITLEKLNLDFPILTKKVEEAQLLPEEMNLIHENYENINKAQANIVKLLDTTDLTVMDNFNNSLVKEQLNNYFKNITDHISHILAERSKKEKAEKKKKEEEEKEKAKKKETEEANKKEEEVKELGGENVMKEE